MVEPLSSYLEVSRDEIEVNIMREEGVGAKSRKKYLGGRG